VIRLFTGADLVLINSGAIRADAIVQAGTLTLRDLKQLVPNPEPPVVLGWRGDVLLAALENGVSCYPRREGRFPQVRLSSLASGIVRVLWQPGVQQRREFAHGTQVSGVSFAFDPRRPPGSRVDADSVRVQGQPLELDREYVVSEAAAAALCSEDVSTGVVPQVGTRQFIAEGKDGYTVCLQARRIRRTDVGVSDMLRLFLEDLQVRARAGSSGSVGQREGALEGLLSFCSALAGP
jgi:hypothetical protein